MRSTRVDRARHRRRREQQVSWRGGERERERKRKKIESNRSRDDDAHQSTSTSTTTKKLSLLAFLKLAAAATALLALLGFLGAAASVSSSFRLPPPYLRRLPGPRVAALPQVLDGGVGGGGGGGRGNSSDDGGATPSSSPSSSSSSWASRMLWGTYRSGNYLGLRTRAPRSLSAGLMWFDPDARPAAEQGAHSFGSAAPTLPPLRHEAQERDRGGENGRGEPTGLQTFGWVRHDGEGYGEQRIVDFGGQLELSTTFVKREVQGSVGGDWALRVSAKEGGDSSRFRSRSSSSSSSSEEDDEIPRKQRVSLLFYVADEGVLEDDDEGNGPLELAGKSAPIRVLPAGDDDDGGGDDGGERGRRRRASAAAEAFSSLSSSSSSGPSSKPVLLASGAGSHPVGAWKLSLVVSSPPSPTSSSSSEEEEQEEEGGGGEKPTGGGGGKKNVFDLRYLGRRRPGPGALLRDLTEAVAAELEVGAFASAADESSDLGGSAAATGRRRRKRRSSSGGAATRRPPLSRHALPNVVDEVGGFETEQGDDDEEELQRDAGGSNLAMFQLTAELPFEADFVFVVGGGQGQEKAAGSSGSSVPLSAALSPSSSSSSSVLARLFRLAPPPSLLEEPLARIPPTSAGARLLSAPLAERVAGLSGPQLTAAAAAAAAAFDARFNALFASKVSEQSGLNLDPRAVESVSKAALSNLLGGMAYFYGSPRVQVPEKKKKRKNDEENNKPPLIARGAPGPLFTATPSRAFFPRGFLWDEGFHQLVLMRWSRPLARDALAHWCDAVTATGWIPREQILGAEAEARVPSEFVAQDPSVANPPTLLLPLSAMARGVAEAEARVNGGGGGEGGRASFSPSSKAAADADARLAALAAVDPEAAADAALLEAAYPRVKRWVEWLLETQAGGGGGSGRGQKKTATTFRWRGRDASAGGGRELNPKTLASGLDDYPRPSHPDEAEERHVDLLCWAALAARLLATVAAGIGGRGAEEGSGGGALSAASASASTDAARFSSLAASLGSLSNLHEHHWDSRNRGFFDWGHHSDDLQLEWRYVLDEETGYPVDRELVRVLKKRTEDGRLVDAIEDGINDANADAADDDEATAASLALTAAVPARFVSHVGYVSLFPFLLRLLPPGSDELAAALDQVEELLDPRSGLASLSKKSSFHAARNTEHDAPYWRGAVWPPVNYLALAALDSYARGGGGVEGGGEGGSSSSSSSAADALRLAERAAGLRDRLRAAFVGNVVSRALASSSSSSSSPAGVCDIWERYDDDGSQGLGVDGRPLELGASSPGEGLGPRPFTGWGSTVALAGAGVYFDI